MNAGRRASSRYFCLFIYRLSTNSLAQLFLDALPLLSIREKIFLSHSSAQAGKLLLFYSKLVYESSARRLNRLACQAAAADDI